MPACIGLVCENPETGARPHNRRRAGVVCSAFAEQSWVNVLVRVIWMSRGLMTEVVGFDRWVSAVGTGGCQRQLPEQAVTPHSRTTELCAGCA